MFYIPYSPSILMYRFDENFILKATQDTNRYYGKKNISASRIIFVNGSIDPWHALGITGNTHQNITSTHHASNNLVVFINGKYFNITITQRYIDLNSACIVACNLSIVNCNHCNKQFFKVLLIESIPNVSISQQ